MAIETRRIPRVAAEAVYTAGSGRPGPVYLEIPQDVLSGKSAVAEGPPAGYPTQRSRPQAAPEQIQAALELLQAAEKPVILAGTGAMWSGAGDAWLSESYTLVDFLRGTWDEQIAAHQGQRVHAGAAARELVAWARETIGDNVTFVADGGDSLVWGLTYMYAEGPGRLLSTTTALGTLDVGLPFAIGAQVARPDDKVILFAGDGAFGFTAIINVQTAPEVLSDLLRSLGEMGIN